MVTLESIACGTPVIVYDNTPMTEFVSKKNGIIINSSTICENIDKIIKIKMAKLKNNKLYNRKNMTKLILEKYNC